MSFSGWEVGGDPCRCVFEGQEELPGQVRVGLKFRECTGAREGVTLRPGGPQTGTVSMSGGGQMGAEGAPGSLG